MTRTVSDAVMDGLELVAAHRPASMAELLGRLGLGSPGSVTAVPTAASTAAPIPVTSHQPVTPPYVVAAPQAVHPVPARQPRPAPPPVSVATPVGIARMAGRWKITLPAYAAAAALGAAAPVLVNAVLAVVVLPGLATAGDAVVLRRQRRVVPPSRWRERVPLPLYGLGRYIRNLFSMAWTAVPALIVIGLLIATSLLLDGSGVSGTVQDLVLRAGGAGVALLLVDGVLANRLRYRACVIEDLGRARLQRPSGRLTRAGWVFLAVVAVLIAVAVSWEPELWPVRS